MKSSQEAIIVNASVKITNHKIIEAKLSTNAFFNILKKKVPTQKPFSTSPFAVSSAESGLTVTIIGVPLILRDTDTAVHTRSTSTWRLKRDRERAANNIISIDKNAFQSPNM